MGDVFRENWEDVFHICSCWFVWYNSKPKVNISNLGATLNCKQTLKSFAHFTQIDGGYLNCGQIFHSPLKRYIRISIAKKFKSKKFAKSGERHVMLGKILEDIIEIWIWKWNILYRKIKTINFKLKYPTKAADGRVSNGISRLGEFDCLWKEWRDLSFTLLYSASSLSTTLYSAPSLSTTSSSSSTASGMSKQAILHCCKTCASIWFHNINDLESPDQRWVTNYT